jgi:hypothetical protein
MALITNKVIEAYFYLIDLMFGIYTRGETQAGANKYSKPILKVICLKRKLTIISVGIRVEKLFL